MNIKIFIAYHNNTTRIKSNILTPIHVGRKISNPQTLSQLNDIIGDDSGDNISERNAYYCELTAQYWAWKNCNADYIGFMHYRRLLNFNLDIHYEEDEWGLSRDKEFNYDFVEKYKLSDGNMARIIKNYDILTVNPWDVYNAGSIDNYDQYASSDEKLHIQDYNKALEIMVTNYKDFAVDAIKYNNDRYGYYTNIFIMRKDIYNNYCNFLFNILFELEKILDISSYNIQEKRVFGYISEWLFGIYITHLKRIGKCKILELQRNIIENVNLVNNAINVVFSSDNNYVKYLGVAIFSLIVNKNEHDILNIYILDGGISSINKNKIIGMQCSNVKIEFIKMNEQFFNDCPIYTLKETHIRIPAYYRLIIHKLLMCDKAIYLDCDLIVRTSLLSLYNIDLCDNYAMGTIDILYKDNTNRLKIDKYINSGVLLLNLAKMRNDYIDEKFFNYIKTQKEKILYHDQDVINVVLQDGISYIDKKWNAQSCEYNGAVTGGWNELAKSSNIVHFISDKKPLSLKNNHPFKNEFFAYLQNSPWRDYRLFN